MDAQLWRLLWALPLVLAVGVLAILAIKRLGFAAEPSRQELPPRVVHELDMGQQTRLIVCEIEGQRWVVVEGRTGLALQALTESRPNLDLGANRRFSEIWSPARFVGKR